MHAEWSMEPAAAAREPRDLQPSNWAMEPAVYATIGLPVDYAFAEIFGNYCLQTSVPAVSKGGQLIECAVDRSEYDDLVETTDQQRQEFVVDLQSIEKTIIGNRVHDEFEELADKCKADIMVGGKMHRYPASIKALGLSDGYTKPMVVSIGPYHHGGKGLKKAERAKYVAASCCIKASGRSPEEMYGVVVQAAPHARSLYDDDVVARMRDDDFLPMMFFDACFLVQYMLITSATEESLKEMDASLRSFIFSNDNEIFHDIMLLENQIPWFLVQAVMELVVVDVDVPVREFVQSVKGCLQDKKKDDPPEEKIYAVNNDQLHLLGLLRFYIVGGSRSRTNTSDEKSEEPEITSISFSVSAAELSEIGIRLKPRETTTEIFMGLDTGGTLFAELSMTPVSLDSARASYLINMAALEMCMNSNFRGAQEEESAVCSYLLLLGMLMGAREEDVQELRTKRLLQGGGGLNNAQALEFFAGVQSLRLGSCYVRIMGDIERYRNARRTWISVHAFFYNNFKVIAAVVSAIVTIVSILGTLLSIKN